MPTVSPAIKWQLRHSASRQAAVRESAGKMREIYKNEKGERESEARSSAEAHIKRIYSAASRTPHHPAKLLHDPEAKALGIDHLQPLSVDLLYASTEPMAHPWLPSSQASSDSSYEDLPSPYAD